MPGDATSRAVRMGNREAQVSAAGAKNSRVLQHVHSVHTTPHHTTQSHTERARSHAGATRHVLLTC